VGLADEQGYLELLMARPASIWWSGARVEDVTSHPATAPAVAAMREVYRLARKGPLAPLLTVGEGDGAYSRQLHVPQSRDDLAKRVEMAEELARQLGTCNYRCVACDALTALSSVTLEMAEDGCGEYRQRLEHFLERARAEDWAISAGLTDPKGDRRLRPGQQPEQYVRVVQRRPDGIVVRGAKLHQSGAVAAHWHLVLPGGALRAGEEEFAVAFAVPRGAPGLSYLVQSEVGRPGGGAPFPPYYAPRHTCWLVFEDVFVPWDEVFLCGEVRWSGPLVSRFARMHRACCGGACKVGFADLVIGAAAALAELSGVAGSPHVRWQLVEMVTLQETWRGCTMAAIYRSQPQPPGGPWLPDQVLSNVAKLNVASGFWRMLALAGDIAGGSVITAPSWKDLCSEPTGRWVRQYMGASGEGRQRLALLHFLRAWVAGDHMVATWHGAGSPAAGRLSLERAVDWEAKKAAVRRLMGCH